MKTREIMTKALIVCLLLTFSGCVAGVTTTKVTPGSNPKGLRVNLPAPFVVGLGSGRGRVRVKVLWETAKAETT